MKTILNEIWLKTTKPDPKRPIRSETTKVNQKENKTENDQFLQKTANTFKTWEPDEDWLKNTKNNLYRIWLSLTKNDQNSWTIWNW